MKKGRFNAACQQRFKAHRHDHAGGGVVLGFGFGGMGGAPDDLRAQMEADGFEVRQVGDDEFEAVRVGAAEALKRLR